MKNLFIAILIIIPFTLFAQFKYPPSRTVDSSDTWHGVTIQDPYRWLEDLKSEEVLQWFRAQADFTNDYMKDLKYTDKLYNEFLKLDSVQPDNIFRVRQVGDMLFYFNMKTCDSKAKLYKRKGDSGTEELLAESGIWGKDYTISDYEIDPYQKYIAISASENGKEFKHAKIFSLEENRFLSDSLHGCFAGFGAGIGNIIYYQQPSWDVHFTVLQKEIIYKSHTIGSKSEEDKVYFSFDTNPEFYSADDSYGPYPISYNSDFKYEIIKVVNVSPFMEIYCRPANTGDAWKKIISFEDEVGTVNGSGNMLYFVSLHNASNGKLMMMDMKFPDVKNATLLAVEKEMPIDAAMGSDGGELSQSKNFLILPYIKNGVQILHDVVDFRSNTVSKIPFPETTNLMYVTPFNKNNDDVHIVRSGWISPMDFTYGNIDNPTEGENVFSFRNKTSYPYTNELVNEEIEIPGHDGVMIPMSLI